MTVVDQLVKVVVVISNTLDNLVDILLVLVVVADTMSFVYKIHYKNYLLLRMTMQVVVQVEIFDDY
jgi:hypothetical protein